MGGGAGGCLVVIEQPEVRVRTRLAPQSALIVTAGGMTFLRLGRFWFKPCAESGSESGVGPPFSDAANYATFARWL